MVQPQKIYSSTIKKEGRERFMTSLAQPTYKCIASLRQDIKQFLSHRRVHPTYIDRYLLSLSEIMTNLIKHPARAADHVDIRLTLENDGLEMDIADNSSSFATFNAKCNSALETGLVSEKFQESGYGLACIVKQHASIGYIPASQSEDGFNHFIIRDPITEGFLAENPIADNLQRKRIFLIDDDPVSLGIHQRMLENVYDVHIFDTAQEALSAFLIQKPDIIISDLNMPEMDGTALRAALNETEAGRLVPFVFLTGHHHREGSPYINKLGIDDFLHKPISKERLLAVAARLLARSAQYQVARQNSVDKEITTLLSPALPEISGPWRIRTLTRAADVGGGDFTLYQETPQRMLGVLGDVMGHGKQAKFFAYAYAGYLRSLFRLLSENADPAYFLEKLSSAVRDDPFLDHVIMTCLAFHLNAQGECILSSAGHPCPFLIRDGRMEMIDVAGPLPGLMGESRYLPKKIMLKRHEKIVLATDGILGALADMNGRVLEANIDTVSGRLWMEYLSICEKNTQTSDDATLIIIEYGG